MMQKIPYEAMPTSYSSQKYRIQNYRRQCDMQCSYPEGKRENTMLIILMTFLKEELSKSSKGNEKEKNC